MYILIKDNVERIVESEIVMAKFIADGFTLIKNEGLEEEFEFEMKEVLNLSEMKLEELKSIAKEKGIEGYSSMKKAELIEKLG